jgi:uncharacterized membrane protein (UPF0127 family)
LLNNIEVDVKVVSSETELRIGLSGKEKISLNEGMLFVFEKPEILSFWMKGVNFPLSIGFFDENQTLIETKEMQVCIGPPYPIYKSSRKAMYALEVPLGFFINNSIQNGTRFKLE